MEIIGIGLEAMFGAIGSIAGWIGVVCIVGISAATYLLSADKISYEDIKELLNKRRKY